jgi:Flp pilus assembly protein TadD
LKAGRDGAPGAAAQLTALLYDAKTPEIARATAASMLGRFPGAATFAAVRDAVGDASALVRAAAFDAVLAFPAETRGPLALSVAGDDVKAVRVKAGRVLAALSPILRGGDATAAQARRLVDEYVGSERAVGERPEAHLNLGIVAAERGDVAEAEGEYRNAIRRDPSFVPAYVNLADLYRAAGRDAESARAVADGLAAVPDDPTLLHALGLQRVREKKSAEALELLRRAAEGRPENARFAYVYAVALHSAGRGDEATAVLAQALAAAPYDPSLLSALAAFERDAGRREEALAYARRLAAVAPDDANVRRLVQELGGE